MPLHAGPAQAPLLRELVEHQVPPDVHLVIDLPTGFALWGMEPLPPPALVLTFNRHPLYLLDLFERRPAGVLLAPDALDALSEALQLVARGHRVGTPPTLPFDAPTPRERQVLRLLAQGLTNREIALRLHLAEGTVKNYVTSILGKLGARDRTQAALRARELGLLERLGSVRPIL